MRLDDGVRGLRLRALRRAVRARDPRLGAPARLCPRLSMRGWPTAIVTAMLGVGLASATLVKLIEDNEFQTGWAWVGLAIALTVMLARPYPRPLPLGDARPDDGGSRRSTGGAPPLLTGRAGRAGRAATSDRSRGCVHGMGERGAQPRERRARSRVAAQLSCGQHTGATRSRRGRFSGRAASRGRRSAS